VEELEKSLRDYASPRCEDIRVQESDSKLEATKYEIKSKIIEMVAENPFKGMVTENPYRHFHDAMQHSASRRSSQGMVQMESLSLITCQ
jgi:hypothetical protein